MGSTVYDCIPVDDCFLTCAKKLDVFLTKAASREFGFPRKPSVINRPRNNTNTDCKRMAFGLTETLPRISDSYIFAAGQSVVASRDQPYLGWRQRRIHQHESQIGSSSTAIQASVTFRSFRQE